MAGPPDYIGYQMTPVNWKARADAAESELAVMKGALAAATIESRERDEARAWRDKFDCCMCGSRMDSHDIGSGHSPVSMYDYEMQSLSAELAKAREALAGILRNHETIGAGASIFQCTTAEVEAARAAMSAR
jgi:dsDNA-binding SOS-regulon protein